MKKNCFECCLKLRDELIKRNPDLTIIMTRTTDKDLTPKKQRLRKRAEIGSHSLKEMIIHKRHANALPSKRITKIQKE
jgi:N-acetylmuramoyl-L-alanine amidase